MHSSEPKSNNDTVVICTAVLAGIAMICGTIWLLSEMSYAHERNLIDKGYTEQIEYQQGTARTIWVPAELAKGRLK